ncbi:hypothetical protein FOZ60_016204 [Perkinsus olseni]|uniref:Uncharacterized protein n=1 Tax=Perkinsus olseni TaxID=32597 RepID=A0A7J6P6X2_PEROL|nr:hypothetical protein FOZ60_016204 [Perkinsus olseni]
MSKKNTTDGGEPAGTPPTSATTPALSSDHPAKDSESGTSATPTTEVQDILNYLGLQNTDQLAYVTDQDIISRSLTHPLDLLARISYQQVVAGFRKLRSDTSTLSTSIVDQSTLATTSTTPETLPVTTSTILSSSCSRPQQDDPSTHGNPLSSLKAPDGQPWKGSHDTRPISSSIQRVADAAQMAGLSDSGLWKYLNLTALQESDSRGLSSHIRQQHLESAPYKE